jgi:cysteine desulfurase/selenocysteine lyase
MTVSARPLFGDRALFPALTCAAYLNHAAISPACAPVVTAVERALHDYAANGAGAFLRWNADRAALRALLAQWIGAREEEIALGSNTSRGVSDIALSIPWRRGDRVVLFSGEFPENVTPWQRAAELFGLELVFLPAELFFTEQGLERLEQELKRGVRLVAVSFVQFQSGLCMPLRAMGEQCRKYGAELFVDAIQGCGAVPLDVEAEQIDYLSCGGHKWLLGMEGAAFTFVRQSCAKALRPYTAGWLSHEDAESFLFAGAGHLNYEKPLKQTAEVFEAGTSSLLSLAALRASLPLLLELGAAAIFEHVQRYHDALESGLVARGFESLRAPLPEQRSGILSLRPPPGIGLVPLATALRKRGVMPGTPDGLLRFAPHFANALTEVPRVFELLDDALAELRAA